MQRDVDKLYKKLNHVEHILLRPDRHVGSTRPRELHTWIYDPSKEEISYRDVTYHPALLKLFDEIIINSVDFSKTPEGSHLNQINVTVNKFMGSITVEDNGGIPVVMHKEYKGWLPDMLFGELYSSSNYNEHDEDLANADGAGQNGEGASLVNVFSKTFTVTTCDGVNRYSRTWRNNMSGADSLPAEVKSTPGAKKGTAISFIPEYHRFRCDKGMTDGDYLMLVRRAFEVAACNPSIKVVLNGKEVRMNHFRDFSRLFGCDAVEETKDWKIGIFKADNPVHHSYVNSVHTGVGGPHVEYVIDKIIEAARPKLKRAYKVDYKPGAIRGVIGLVLICNIKIPRFDSQTKENMTTKVSEFGTKWEPSAKFLEKASASIVKWMGDYHESLLNKEDEKAIEDAEKEISKIRFHDIPKYDPATSKNRGDCVLFLTEGDSAAKPILAARDTKVHGVFPLRGKILNLIGASKRDIAKNKEIQNIIAIMKGLSIKDGVDFDKLRYKEIVVATDADADGIHIRGLLCNAFMTLWPDFIRQGRLKYLETPVVVAKKGKEVHEFFEECDFEDAIDSGKKFDAVKYLKGLGSNDSASFRKYLYDGQQYQKPFVYDQEADAMIDLAFNTKRADDRKPLFSDLSFTQLLESE